MSQAAISEPARRGKKHSTGNKVERAAQRRLAACPYAFVFSKVVTRFEDGRLKLQGSVPSFYLKQMLQEVLRGIEHVERIENNVDVVCSDGLSSVRTDKPK